MLDYVDLKEKGFLRRENLVCSNFDNNLTKKWEIDLPPEIYQSAPKPFYQLTANDDFIYFLESGVSQNSSYICKVTQLNYQGEVVSVKIQQDINSRIFSTFPVIEGCTL